MSLSIAAKISVGVSCQMSNPQNLTAGSKKFDDNFLTQFITGNGNGQIQAEWDDERTIAASGTDPLDLAGGLKDIFGNTITFSQVKAIIIIADEGNTNSVLVGGAASNTFPFLGDVTDVVPVKPGGMFVWTAPNAGAQVTAGTGDQLKIANSGSGTGVTYKVIIMGTAVLTAP